MKDKKIITKENKTLVINARVIGKKILKAVKIGLFLTLIITVFIILQNLIAWFRSNTIIFQSPIEMKFNKPVQIKTLEQVAQEEQEREKAEKENQLKDKFYNKKDEIYKNIEILQEEIKKLEGDLEKEKTKYIPQRSDAGKATITAYTCDPSMTSEQKKINCPNGITATGIVPKAGITIACDRANLGRVFEIEEIGQRVCQDTGGSIKGAGRFDLYVDSLEEALKFGKRQLSYKLVN